MRKGLWLLIVALLCVTLPVGFNQAASSYGASNSAPAALPSSPPQIDLTLVGRYTQPDYAAAFEQGAAEIVDHDPVTERLFVVNGFAKTIDVLDISTPSTPTLAFSSI